MFKSRNLLVVSLVLISMMVFLIPLAAAQPAMQATETPEPTATVEATVTPMATSTTEATVVPDATSTAIAPVVSPVATAVGTPSTLPTTGESDGNTAALALLVLAVGALIIVGAIGLAAASRRTQ